jgi:hypothetical protein
LIINDNNKQLQLTYNGRFFGLGGSRMTPSIVEEIDFVGMFLNDLEDESNFRNSLINGSESERVIGPPFPKNFTNFSIENREEE